MSNTKHCSLPCRWGLANQNLWFLWDDLPLWEIIKALLAWLKHELRLNRCDLYKSGVSHVSWDVGGTAERYENNPPSTRCWFSLAYFWVCFKNMFSLYLPYWLLSFLPAGEGRWDPGMTRSGSKLFLSVTQIKFYSGSASSCCCLTRVFLCSSEYEHGLCVLSSNWHFLPYVSTAKGNIKFDSRYQEIEHWQR